MTQFAPKPIPMITWGNMVPPFRSHLYFEHGKHLAFEPHASTFSPTNAWWLSEAALLAYTDEAFAKPIFNAAGFQEVAFFSGHSTQCYLAGNQHFSILAFRGTECGIDQGPEAMAQFIADLSVDIDIRWVDAADGGKIHRGFSEALDEVLPELLPHLEELDRLGRPLWVTGHSLGGALAILTAYRLDQCQGIYTFGAPRVGNRKFTSQYPMAVHQFANNNDVVPHLPPFPYADLGTLHYIDLRGAIQESIGTWERFKDEIHGHIQCLVENVRHLRQDLTATLPDGIKDHTPLLYALHLWNHLVSFKSQ